MNIVAADPHARVLTEAEVMALLREPTSAPTSRWTPAPAPGARGACGGAPPPGSSTAPSDLPST